MASNLPLSLQERIIFFAGSPQPTAPATTTPTPSNTTALDSSVLETNTVPTLVPRPPVQPGRGLSPSDLFVLNADEGPGFVVFDTFLGAVEAQAVAAEAQAHGGLRAAGMGRGLGQWSAPNARGDATAWLHEADEAAPRLRALLGSMRALGGSFVPTWAAGGWSSSSASGALGGVGALTGRLSHQLARYPGDGSGYVRHRDAYPAAIAQGAAAADATAAATVAGAATPAAPGSREEEDATRRLTAIYYLNAAWLPEHGGQLRLYGGGGAQWDLEPKLDRLVVFRADRVDHEVRGAHVER